MATSSKPRITMHNHSVSPRGLARAIFLDEPCDITSLVVALIEGQGHPGSSLDHTKIMKALVNWHHDEIKVQKIESAAYQDYLNSAEHA